MSSRLSLPPFHFSWCQWLAEVVWLHRCNQQLPYLVVRLNTGCFRADVHLQCIDLAAYSDKEHSLCIKDITSHKNQGCLATVGHILPHFQINRNYRQNLNSKCRSTGKQKHPNCFGFPTWTRSLGTQCCQSPLLGPFPRDLSLPRPLSSSGLVFPTPYAMPQFNGWKVEKTCSKLGKLAIQSHLDQIKSHNFHVPQFSLLPKGHHFPSPFQAPPLPLRDRSSQSPLPMADS